jgi:hypothetical protein
LAALGLVVFTCALAAPTASASARAVLVADAVATTAGGPGAELTFDGTEVGWLDAHVARTRVATPPPAPRIIAAPTLAPPKTSGIVVASWYGPGFYGNRTACGQVYTPEIVGVAHRSLPCGTQVRITFRSTTVVVPVIDRGPYIEGRTLDLSNATRGSLRCTDLCTVLMQLGH